MHPFSLMDIGTPQKSSDYAITRADRRSNEKSAQSLLSAMSAPAFQEFAVWWSLFYERPLGHSQDRLLAIGRAIAC
jgi:hypothetical protein